VELLADVDKIRQERKRAKANRSKYVGTGSDGFAFGGGGRYDGFGSYSGDYGGSATGYDRGELLPLLWKIVTHGQSTDTGGSSSGFRDTTPKRTDFEEYDAGEDEASARRTTATGPTSPTGQSTSTRSYITQSKAAGKVPEPVPAPVMNLLDLDDTEPGPTASGSATMSAAATDKALPALGPLVTNSNGTRPFFRCRY
jgi:epsin